MGIRAFILVNHHLRCWQRLDSPGWGLLCGLWADVDDVPRLPQASTAQQPMAMRQGTPNHSLGFLGQAAIAAMH